MDEEDFEDLIAEADLLQGSSQESLTAAVANVDLYSHGDSDVVSDLFGGHISEGWPIGKEVDSLGDASGLTSEDVLPLDGASTATAALPRVHVSSAIQKIEAVFGLMVDALADEKELHLELTSRRPTKKTNRAAHYGEAIVRRICFPGKSPEEAWRFTVVTRILELMHEALRNEMVISKRDIYYRDPALFGSQTHVDRYVDDIAFTFGLTRSALNVAAAAKGLVAGALTFCRRDGSTVNATAERDGMLVPGLRDILSVQMSNVKWILVIEKEATFRSIAASMFWDRVTSDGVIITGKGYPDLATRSLLHFLSQSSLKNGFASPPVYGLADFDPDGLAILSTYKHGSKALAHESVGMLVPELIWIGLRSEHLLLHANDLNIAQGLLPLTVRDRRKAMKMLEWEVFAVDGEETECRAELQRMLMLDVKAEMQLLDALPEGMSALLSATIHPF